MAKTVQLRIAGIVVVELKGKIDTLTAAATERELFEHCAGARHLVVDMSAVGYLNGAGLRILLNAAQRLQMHGGQLILCAVPSYIREVLDIAGVTSVFPVWSTRAEALAAAEESASRV
jgi:stage II sporulation protein AA (anti-sigma F factor antagonist)